MSYSIVVSASEDGALIFSEPVDRLDKTWYTNKVRHRGIDPGTL